MKIKDIFAKSIDRSIKGVITIGDEQDANVKQELEEYVVTKELDGHFKDFFAAYAEGIQHDTTNMGVWISGFFGSGKSHFLKILAYLLENREVAGKTALDYFVDDAKVHDQATLANMKLAASVPNEVMLFNIDSKAKNGNKSEKDAILNVFLQVFNEQLRLFGADFWIADLERDLIAQGKYAEFQAKFKELDRQNRDWLDARNAYAFLKGTIRDTLVGINFMSEADADGFIDQLKKEYPVSVEGFAKLVNQHIEAQGENYHMAFLVDEVGQYIGSSQQRMLNLQSIVEDLGTYTHGKAWVIVTSQQAIDKVTKNINGQDFSKIQGRFNTRIAMSSANVDEVIQKRLLSKTAPSEQLLETTFDENQHVINNLISFDGKEERKRYDNAKMFADLYPFVPYQVVLLQDTLTAIRENGSDGKHLANGERSMLAVFQESAQRVENEDTRALVPFSIFFQGLSRFLDHTHMIVIQRAQNNELINPSGEDNPFAVQVLETLFMIKYVQDFDGTLNNLVTLMIDSIDADRIELEAKVKAALQVLQEQNIVEKTSKGYEFLTDAEQDISKQIQRQGVDSGAVSQAIGEYLFSSEGISRRYTYPKLKQQYTFVFNAWVDDRPVGKSMQDINLKIVTAMNEDNRADSELRRQSTSPEQPQIIIDLPGESQYVDDQQQALRMQQFILSPQEQAQDARSQRIIDVKKTELHALNKQVIDELLEALQQANIYVQGDRIDAGKKDFFTSLAQAEEQLIDEIYRNLSYIDVVKQDSDVVALFKDTDELVKTTENERALQAVLERIIRDHTGHNKVSFKSVLERFNKIPYGYREIDTKWLVAKLFADAKLKVYVNGEALSLQSGQPANEIAKYFLKRQYLDAVQMEPRQAVSEDKKKDLREVALELFSKQTFSDNEDDTMMHELQASLDNARKALDVYLQKPDYYPGQDVLRTGRDLMKQLLAQKDTDRFYDLVSQKRDDLLDWHDDMDDGGINEFYQSDTQQEIWKSGHTQQVVYDRSQRFVTGTAVKTLISQIDSLMKKRPQGNIKNLKDLVQEFQVAFNAEFDAGLGRAQQDIQNEQAATEAYCEDEHLTPEFGDRIRQDFEGLLDDAREATTLNDLFIIPQQATAVRVRLVHKMDQVLAERKPKPEIKPDVVTPAPKTGSDGSNSTGDDDTDTVTPDKVVDKRVKEPRTVKAMALGINQSWELHDTTDLDAQIEGLRQALARQLAANGPINFKL
ncbi:BREX system P-loop protein BrxC [Levilactobacillus cerevisiae]|uniref:BREX system P-loop protein BrxC n=1 Tax=Levilactobacillus cerevisiae TaxID=1704076 RepID=UPI000F7793CC|nr:BREX system P-loop protein BrxC [Levilactobacillus cerevisiae]